MTSKVGELLEEAADIVVDWLDRAEIELAIQKTELLLPTKRRTHNVLEVNIRGHRVISQQSVKYLGVNLDQTGNFKIHATSAAEKADRAIRSLRGIMPNLRGPGHHARKLLVAVPLSIMLYGAPIRSRRMSKAGWGILARCQRRIALRVATAYRTISGEALLVLAGVPPIDLLATERTAVYEGSLRDGDTTEL